MARTYLSGTNSRNNLVTAANSKFCHLRGWNAGVEIRAFVTSDGKDIFNVYMTNGSTGAGSDTLVGAVLDTENGPKWLPNE